MLAATASCTRPAAPGARRLPPGPRAAPPGRAQRLTQWRAPRRSPPGPCSTTRRCAPPALAAKGGPADRGDDTRKGDVRPLPPLPRAPRPGPRDSRRPELTRAASPPPAGQHRPNATFACTRVGRFSVPGPPRAARLQAPARRPPAKRWAAAASAGPRGRPATRVGPGNPSLHVPPAHLLQANTEGGAWQHDPNCFS